MAVSVDPTAHRAREAVRLRHLQHFLARVANEKHAPVCVLWAERALPRRVRQDHILLGHERHVAGLVRCGALHLGREPCGVRGLQQAATAIGDKDMWNAHRSQFLQGQEAVGRPLTPVLEDPVDVKRDRSQAGPATGLLFLRRGRRHRPTVAKSPPRV